MQHFLWTDSISYSAEALDFDTAGFWGDQSEKSVEKDENRRNRLCRIRDNVLGNDHTRQVQTTNLERHSIHLFRRRSTCIHVLDFLAQTFPAHV